MNSNDTLFSSESVTAGHPDKVADQISDAVLDAFLTQDPQSRVACETLLKGDLVVVAGEIRSAGHIQLVPLVKKTIAEIGYTSAELGFDLVNCRIVEAFDAQSQDIAAGVDAQESKEQGAGDQGMMFGFACRDTPELMPAPVAVAHSLTQCLDQVRRSEADSMFRPDGKAQVTFVYEGLNPVAIDTLVVSAQHVPQVSHRDVEQAVIEKVIKPTLAKTQWKLPKKIYINPTGRFVSGGPAADTGLTGRKIIVDTYGGMGRHGGGAFSGKDASKVDRSAAYFARYMAKNIVAAELASRCEVQLAYAIGRAEPVSLRVDTFGTGRVAETQLAAALRAVFDARPKQIINRLKLQRPIFQATASYGHFGQERPERLWEMTDRVTEVHNHI